MIHFPPRKYVEIPEDFREKRVRVGRSFINVTLPPVIRQPFIYNLGMGTDSVAGIELFAELVKRGNKDAMPDRVVFADTGSEKRNTYDFISVMQRRLAELGFPELLIVKKQNCKHASLADQCLNLHTLPSIAYGGSSCTLKWKAAVMDMSHSRWLPAIHAWAAGLKPRKFIGYDGGEADCRRSAVAEDDKYEYIYPLREAGYIRGNLQAIIRNAGLPDPGKSACFMCPASKKPEIVHLGMTEPDKLAIALRMEARALVRTAMTHDTFSTKGLGRRYAWREFLEESHPNLLQTVRGAYDIGDADWSTYRSIVDPKCPA